jgi:hypothetical protein
MSLEGLSMRLREIEVQLAVLQVQMKKSLGAIEAQLAVLRAQVGGLDGPPHRRFFSALEGVLEPYAQSSEEDVEAAEYRFEWDHAHDEDAPQ